jgi:hypothetical protein
MSHSVSWAEANQVKFIHAHQIPKNTCTYPNRGELASAAMEILFGKLPGDVRSERKPRWGRPHPDAA